MPRITWPAKHESCTKTPTYWNQIASDFGEKHSQQLWRSHSDAINFTLLERWLPGRQCEYFLKTDLFDEALGDGLYSIMTSFAKRVVGIDLSIRTLRSAVSHLQGLQTVNSDVRHLPFADGSFDVIISNSTLDHFASRNEILLSLREFHRVLRKKGRLILTLDNLSNPIIILRELLPFRLLHRIGVVPYYVGLTYRPKHLRCVIEKIGFEVSAMSAIMHCPRIFAVLAARVLERTATHDLQRRFLRCLMAMERMEHWPTLYLTGHFIAILAVKH